MSTQEYSLRWNNHQPNFISMFTQFLDTKTLTDCTLVVEDQRLTAHKVILSACSTFFYSIFIDVHDQAYHPIIVLNNVTYEDVKTVLQFMYYGAVNVTAEQLPRVIETGKLLKVKGLTEMTGTSPSVSQPVSTQDEPSPRHDHSKLPTPSPPLTEMPSSPPKHKIMKKSSYSSTSFNIELAEDSQPQETGPADMLSNEQITPNDVTLNTPQDDNVDRTYTIPTPQSLYQQGSDSMAMDTQMPIGRQWSIPERTYTRYPNTSTGGGMQTDSNAMYVNNVMHQQIEADMNVFGQGPSVAGMSPQSCSMSDVPSEQDSTTPAPPIKKKRIMNPQSEENFQRALELVRFGGVGFCKAAKMFGVNNRTLWLEYKKKGYPIHRPSIRNRVKREPMEVKEEVQQPEQVVICSQPPVQAGFIESHPLEFPLQGLTPVQCSQINLLGVNFNQLQ